MKLENSVTCAVLAAALTLLGSGVSRADPTNPGKFEPGQPPDWGGGGTEWRVTTIAGLPSQTRLGALWASEDGSVYVWGVSPLAERMVTPEDSRREFEPRDPIDGTFFGPPQTTLSTLYRWDGTTWRTSLAIAHESAATVFGSGKQVYAATNLADNGVSVRVFNGKKWKETRLPYDVHGPAGQFAGDSKHVYFRTGDAILRLTGNHWKVVYRNPRIEAGEGLVYLDKNYILAASGEGYATWNGKRWTWTVDNAAVCRCYGWGGLDAAGVPHVFFTGENLLDQGPCIYGFDSPTCSLDLMFEDIPAGASEHSGDGDGMWGAGPHDVYATGLLRGHGRLYHFDGEQWSMIDPMGTMPPLGGISGTRDGWVVVSLSDGRLLHSGALQRVRRAADEEPEAAAPAAAQPGAQFSVYRESSGAAIVEFTLAEPAEVSIAFFDIAGRRVGSLGRSVQPAGLHRLRWEPTGLPSGVYFCRLQTGDRAMARALSVVR